MLETALAAVALVGLIAYGLLGGADFGGGVWDLFASGPRRGAQRAAIASAMGPVWEANHVWLIFVIVILFTAFPAAFYALSVGLFVPFHLVLLGITLRGAAFVFRSYGPQSIEARARWGALFGAASAITPVLLGMCVGAVTSGSLRMHNGLVTSQGSLPWLAPISLALGAAGLSLCAYLAAVYLTVETQGELREDFRKRAMAAWAVVLVGGALTLPFARLQAPHLWAGLTQPWVVPVLAAGTAAAITSGWALVRRRYRLARTAAVIQVGALVFGWGVAQYPHIVYPDVTISNAAPAATLRFVLWALPFGALLLVPSLWMLFKVFHASDQAR